MADRPIIFSGPMVRALLDGRKTQTRRIVKVPGIMGGRYPILPPEEAIELEKGEFRRGVFHYDSTGPLSGPYRLPACFGDRLYVREAFAENEGTADGVIYRAEHPGAAGITIYDLKAGGRPTTHVSKWRPSIHMPRWASRLTLHVEDVRVERLQSISEADAIAEGIRRIGHEFGAGKHSTSFDAGPNLYTVDFDGHGLSASTAASTFRLLWQTLHGPESWDANPFVVALTFRVENGNIDNLVAGRAGGER